MNTFRFKISEEGDEIKYEEFIKSETKKFKENNMYDCPNKCQSQKMKNNELKEHILTCEMHKL